MLSSVSSYIKIVAGIAIAAWLGVTIYQEFIIVDPDQYSFMSADVQAQMKSCGGSYQQRYECKDAIIRAKGQRSFGIWLEKVAVIFLPPAGLWALVVVATRQRRRTSPTSAATKRRPGPPRTPRQSSS